MYQHYIAYCFIKSKQGKDKALLFPYQSNCLSPDFILRVDCTLQINKELSATQNNVPATLKKTHNIILNKLVLL